MRKLLLFLLLLCVPTACRAQGSGQFSGNSSGSVSLPTTLSAPGVFTNTAGVNSNFQILINTLNPGTEWTGIGQPGADTEAFTAGILIPSTSTAHQATGIAAYANSSSTSTNGVGGYFQARAGATGVDIWPIMSDGGFAVGFMQNEFDVNVSNSGTKGVGISLTGVWTAQPPPDVSFLTGGNFPALSVNQNGAVPNNNTWTSGIYIATGSIDNGGAAIILPPVAPGNSVFSNFITLTSTSSSGSHFTGAIAEMATGFLQIGKNGIVFPTTFTVSALPSASVSGAGSMAVVTDASTFTVGTCTGGGSDVMIAVSNGTTWSCH